MSKNEDARVEMLVKKCSVFGCTINGIMEILSDNTVSGGKKNV